MALTILLGLFGLIIGSFLNVLIFRWGERPLTGRSVCTHCGKMIAWYDNVPVFSWVFLLGKCRNCKHPISLQYPLVEGATALLFGLLVAWVPPVALLHGYIWPLLVDYLLIAALLVAIAVYDLRTTYIPDAWVYTFVTLAFLSQFLTSGPSSLYTVLFLSGPIAAALLFALWLVSKGTWMGFGDVKLALGMGYLLGPVLGFAAVMLAFILGAIVSLTILLPLPAILRTLGRWGITKSQSHQSYTMKSEVPFGPFLVAATLIVWLSNIYGLIPHLSLF